jgi:hypothetical protein
MAPFRQTTLPAHLNPVKPQRGRPTDYRPEYCEAVIAAMSEGLSLTAFAGLIGQGRDTVYKWIRAHSEFSDAVTRARAARVLWLERKLLRSRKGAETTAAIFALKNAAPDEWRDIKTAEHKLTVDVATLTDQQLAAIASGTDPRDVGVTGTLVEGDFERLKG